MDNKQALIDKARIDRELARLINRRMELALRTASEPPAASETPEDYAWTVFPELHRRVASEIDSGLTALLRDTRSVMVFSGEHGSFAEEAAKVFDPAAVAVSTESNEDIFSLVEKRSDLRGIIPVQNSRGGFIADINELFLSHTVHVTGEIYLPVRHSLLTLPETDHRDIRVVYSHPQALAQCRGFLERMKIEPRPYHNTAAAARMLSVERISGAAVLANPLCAELYGLKSVKDAVEDSADNVTRFMIISQQPAEHGDACSIVFSAPNAPGALFSVLKIFSERSINLSRIESMPDPRQVDSYCFFLDCNGLGDAALRTAVFSELSVQCASWRLLGCYPAFKGNT